MNDGTIPQYPWHEGDTVYASALNAAIANSGSGNTATSVRDFGAVGNGVTNDTAAIAAAAAAVPASGGVLLFPPGVYVVTTVTLLKSRTTVLGAGATLLAAPTGFVNGQSLLMNVSNTVTALTDHDIAIYDLTFDYGSSGQGGNAHAINLVFVTNVIVSNCTFQCRGAGNAVAGIGSRNVLVDGCTAYGFTNCAYDFWTKPQKVRVTNCYAETASSVGFVNFNPENTTLGTSAGNVADGFIMSGNHFVCTGGTASAIQIEPLETGTTVRNVTVTDNIFDNVRLLLRGTTLRAVVTSNQFIGPLNDAPALMCGTNLGGTTDDIVVIGNHVYDPHTTLGNYGVLVTEATHATVTGNSVIGTNYTAYGVYCMQPGGFVFGNYVSSGSNFLTSGALSISRPDNTTVGGNNRGSVAVDLQTIRGAATQVASGDYSFCAGANNTASGVTASALGNSNIASSLGAFAANGFNTAIGQYSSVLGVGNVARGDYTFSIGHGADDHGRLSCFSFSSGELGTAGDVQVVNQTLRATTTSATPVVATADGAAASAVNVFNVPPNTFYRLAIRVVAKNFTTGGAGAAWVADNVLLACGVNAASTTLSAVTFTQGGVLGTVTGWTVAAAADTTRGGIAITCTGIAANTIHWAVHIESVEVQ